MNQVNLHWFQWGLLGIHAAISQATMNQFKSDLVCEGFSSCSTDNCHEIAEMQKIKFDDVILQYRLYGWSHKFNTIY